MSNTTPETKPSAHQEPESQTKEKRKLAKSIEYFIVSILVLIVISHYLFGTLEEIENEPVFGSFLDKADEDETEMRPQQHQFGLNINPAEELPLEVCLERITPLFLQAMFIAAEDINHLDGQDALLLKVILPGYTDHDGCDVTVREHAKKGAVLASTINREIISFNVANLYRLSSPNVLAQHELLHVLLGELDGYQFQNPKDPAHSGRENDLMHRYHTGTPISPEEKAYLQWRARHTVNFQN